MFLLHCTSQLLARSGSLHHLRAAGCGIGDEGAVTIAQGLAVNRSLKTFDLGYVGTRGGQLVSYVTWWRRGGPHMTLFFEDKSMTSDSAIVAVLHETC